MKNSYICSQKINNMIQEYKVFDNGRWLPRDELRRCYNETVNSLKTNEKYSHITSRTLGQLYLFEELIAKCDKILRNNKFV